MLPDNHPAVVVLATQADPAPGSTPESTSLAGVLRETVACAIQTRWRVVVVTTPVWVPLMSDWVATRDLVALAPEELSRGLGFALSVGVAAHADAGGWVLLPGDRARVRPETVLAVGEALKDHPVAYAQHRGRRGFPHGFGAELVSDLMTLQGDDGPERLLARYPAWGVEVDDPGALLDATAGDDPGALRAAG